MKMDINKKWPIAALSMIGIASSLTAARGGDKCAPEPAAACYAENCNHCYCLGPENYGVNAPVSPKTCNGDIVLTFAGFYWNAHQDGMEYAITNSVKGPGDEPAAITAYDNLNNLVDATYNTPNFQWDFGFKAGIGYASPCDGWDFGILWTWYHGRANDEIEAEASDNQTILPLWSAYAPIQGGVLYATDVETHWQLKLNLIDVELGRNFWTSKYLAMRPFVGVRLAYIDQSFEIKHRGGSWNANAPIGQQAFNGTVSLGNDYKGVGLRGGLNTVWHLGCGWGVYGDFALAILYGRFDFEQDETNRNAENAHEKAKIADAANSFRASRATADLALGVEWETMFCECKYGFNLRLGWEHHLFFDQNQMWRVVRIGDTRQTSTAVANNTGENVFHERRGDLDTQGWTLRAQFAF